MGRRKRVAGPAVTAETYGLSQPVRPLGELEVVAPQLLASTPKYDKKHVRTVLEYMARGYSLGGVAGAIGVSRQQINVWSGKDEEFAQACARGQAFRQLYWEGRLLEVAETGGTGSQGNVAIFGVLNAGREDWSNRTHIEHSGSVSLSASVDAMLAELERKAAERRAQKANQTPIIELNPVVNEETSDCF